MALSIVDTLPITGHTAAPAGSPVYTGYTYTVQAGSNRVLVLIIAVGDAENNLPSAVTYGGQAMTQLWSVSEGSWPSSQGWGLKESGITAATDTTFSATLADNAAHFIAGAFTVQDVEQTTTYRNSGVGTTATGTSVSPTVSAIPSAVGDLVIAGIGTEDDNAFAEGGTLIFEVEGLGADTGGGAQSYAGAATVTATWSTNNVPWAVGGISLIPAAGGAAPPPWQRLGLLGVS